jgi:hypothetical protein
MGSTPPSQSEGWLSDDGRVNPGTSPARGLCQLPVGSRERIDLVVVPNLGKRAQLVQKLPGPRLTADHEVPGLCPSRDRGRASLLRA